MCGAPGRRSTLQEHEAGSEEETGWVERERASKVLETGVLSVVLYAARWVVLAMLCRERAEIDIELRVRKRSARRL
jgi:hypothetical protein